MNASVPEKRIQEIFAETAAAHAAAAISAVATIAAAAEALEVSLTAGGKILVFGNGGSAADSQHFAAEFIGRFRVDRQAIPAIALTTDTSILTSIANDYSYERVFARQIEALGRKGDVAFGITTSGQSPNVLVALAQARRQGLATIALVGTNRDGAAAIADIAISVPASSTARIQEVHRTILHILCELVEDRV